jgi:uncharacterized protein DUF4255
MIDPLESIVRDLVQSRVATLAGPTQIGFAPPNADWRAAVVAAGEERLNLYLYDMRENMRLRTNEVTSVRQDESIFENLPSPRLEHSTRLADDPTRALSGPNLQWVLADENSVNLEYIRSKDPFQRPPTGQGP